MSVHRNMYAYDIQYYHTSYGWIMSRAVHIYVYRGNRVEEQSKKSSKTCRAGRKAPQVS